ncbi:biotin--[acetyl-CoA-carboxylase] ligase [Desulfoplanes sp.]
MRIIVQERSLKDIAEPYAGKGLEEFRSKWDTGSGAALHVFGPCSSSMDVAWELSRAGGFGVWDSLLASSQWSGRGQMRREWISPEGNIYAAWRWPLPPDTWGMLVPLVAGVLVHDFFARQGIFLRIKWPNDLLLDGRKIGGILVEERSGVLVVGIGLNLVWAPDPARMRRETSIVAGTLSSRIEDSDHLSLWAQLVSRGRFWYEKTLSSYTPAGFVSLLDPLLAFMHQHVQVVTGDSRYRALLTGVQDDGGLVLVTRGQKNVLYSGNILPLDDHDTLSI